MEQTVSKINPLGTEPIGKLMVCFAVPSIIALVVNSLYNMVDQIFIGHGVGYLGNAATNVILPIMTVILAVGLMFGDGCAYFRLGGKCHNGYLGRSYIGQYCVCCFNNCFGI